MSIAVIPLRAGSRGFPGKNLAELAGQPLFMHSVQCARQAGIKRVVVATDIPALLDNTHEEFETFARSKYSARDDAGTHEVVIELIEAWNLHDQVIVLLQATSPLRRAETVRSAITLLEQRRHDLVCSASLVDSSLLKAGFVDDDDNLRPLIDARTLFIPRQGLPSVYKLDGGVFAFRGSWIVQNGSLMTDRIGVVRSRSEENLDIDAPEDLECAKQRLESGPVGAIGGS